MAHTSFAGQCLLAGACIAALEAPARAQTVVPPAVSAPAAEAEPQIGDIVVTARKRQERLIDVPVAATVVGPAEIRRYNITSFSNIRVAAPQVSFDKAFSASGASVVLRGISSSPIDAGLEQSVLLDIDGMPVSRGRIFNDALFDLEGIDVLKGPQALYYGKNAPAGVVSVRSAGPGSDFGGYARGGYETAARTASLEAAVGGPINDKLGFRVAVFASQGDGFLKNDARAVSVTQSGVTYNVPPAPSRLGAERKLAGRLTLTYNPTDDLRITAKVLASRFRSDGLSSLLEVMSCPAGATRPTSFGLVDPNGDCRLNNHNSSGFLPPEVAQPWTQLSSRFSTREPRAFNNSVLPTLRIDYTPGAIDITSVTGFYHYNFGSSGNQDATSYTQLFSTSTERINSFFQELRALTKFDSPINFAFGGFFQHDHRIYKNGSLITYLPADPATGRHEAFNEVADNTGRTWSVFGQGIWKILDNLELDAGARYTKERKGLDLFNVYVHPTRLAAYRAPNSVLSSSRTEDNVSPEATLTWHPSRNLMFYGAYKTGYLAGGFSNPGNISPALTVATNTYDAEKAKGFELGSKFEALDNKLTGSVTLYTYKFSGLQLTSYDVPSNTFVTRNAAGARTRGVEAEARYRITPSIQLFGSGSYNDAYYLSFPNGQCYFGQTAALGCVTVPGTAARVQNQEGQPLNRAPKWIFTAGALYDAEITDTLKMGFTADVRTTSSYFANVNLNPASRQKGFAMVNGSVSLGAIDDRWTLSVIGRNLSNRHYATLGLDKPGGAGEVETIAAEPRTFVLQVSTRF